MLDKSYEVSFQIILHAGDARTKALQAMKCANEDNFLEAESLVKEAKKCLKEAHKSQTLLIQQEAGGEHLEVNVMLVHGQDHFAMAMTAIDLAEQTIIVNKKIKALRMEGKEVYS